MRKENQRFLPYWAVIVSNLLLVIVPTLIIITFFLSQSNAQVKSEVIEMRRVNLEKTQRGIDDALENFSSMALYASLDNALRPYQLSQNDYNAITALHHIKQHASALSDMEVYFYIHGDSCLYSRSGRMDFSVFERVYVFDGDWSAESFFDFIGNEKPFTVSPSGCFLRREPGAREYIAMLYPWRYGNVTYGSVVALIQTEWLDEQLKSEYDDPVWLLNEQGEPITGSALPEGISPACGDTVTVNENRQYVISKKSTLTGWQYMTVLPEKRISAMLYGKHLRLFIIVFAIVLAFSAGGVCLAIRYYRPINALEDVLSADHADNAPMHDRVRHILERNHDMREALDQTRDFMQQDFVLQIMRTHLPEEECAARLRKLDIRLQGDRYAAMIISFDANAAAAVVTEATELLNGMGICCTDASRPGGLNVIALLSFSDGEERFAASVVERLSALPARMGIGQPCLRLSELNRSYAEALAALRYAEAEPCCYFNDIPNLRFNLIDASVNAQTICLCEMIRQGEPAETEKALDDLRKKLRQISEGIDASGMRFILDTILHELMRLFSESGLKDIDWKLNLAVHAAGYEQFVDHLHPLCLQAVEAVRQKSNGLQNQRCAEILRYIDEHYMEYKLSQASVASLFDYTPTALSRLFSDCVGMRFIDYVSQKRMTRAAALLAQSEWGIREIVNMVGYVDVSSFSRKFAATYGMSPTAYREQYKNTQSNA